MNDNARSTAKQHAVAESFVTLPYASSATARCVIKQQGSRFVC